MQSTWIVDVIADLRTYARTNDLSALAEQLDDALMVAAIETAPVSRSHAVGVRGAHENVARSDFRAFGEIERA